MTTTASIGYGTLFKTGDGMSPEVFTTLSEVIGITPPSMSRDSVDVTHEQSPSAWREFIAGLKDAGEISLEMNFDPKNAGASSLMAELALSGPSAVKNRQIVFPDGSMFTFAAFLTKYDPDAPLAKSMSAKVTFKITGAPTLTPGP